MLKGVRAALPTWSTAALKELHPPQEPAAGNFEALEHWSYFLVILPARTVKSTYGHRHRPSRTFVSPDSPHHISRNSFVSRAALGGCFYDSNSAATHKGAVK